MLDIKFIRENPDVLRKAIEVKNAKFDLDALLAVDKEVVALKTQLQELQASRNAHSKKIPKASKEERPALIEEGRKIGNEVDAIKPILAEKEATYKDLMYQVPNIPSADAPLGNSEEDNVEIKKSGSLPNFDFKPLDHVEILEKNQWADFEKVSQVCGSRSYSLRNDMVLLELAVHRYAMEILQKKGFTLVSFPAFVREEALYGTGHLPKGRDQVYELPEHDLHLSGTAEVQANSLHAGEIFSESDLPILYAGYSTCFRSEAGSYGRDVRGLIRVHQFMN